MKAISIWEDTNTIKKVNKDKINTNLDILIMKRLEIVHVNDLDLI